MGFGVDSCSVRGVLGFLAVFVVWNVDLKIVVLLLLVLGRLAARC